MTSSSTSYLIIRSLDRGAGQTDPNNIIITPASSYFSVNSVKAVTPESFQMLYDIPNINIRNNVMIVDDGTTSYPVVIDEGFYDFFSLAAAMQIKLNTLGIGAFTFSWSTTKYKFVMGAPVPVFFTKFPSQKRDLTMMLGFQYDQAPSVLITGGYSDLNYTRDIYVCSSQLHKNKRIIDQVSDTQINDVLMTVPIYPNEEFKRTNADDSGSVSYLLNPRNLFHEPHNPKVISYDINDSFPSIDIILKDDVGDILYNPYTGTGNNWRLSLLLTKWELPIRV